VRQIIFGEERKLWSWSVCPFLRPSATPSLLGPTVSFSNSTSNTVSFLALMWRSKFSVRRIHGARGVFRPRQTRQLPRAVDLKGRLLSCQSY